MQPSYFYHLAFELYAPEARAYVPPPGTDIFEADLPVHDTIPWKASPPKRPSHKRSNTETFDSSYPPLRGQISSETLVEDSHPPSSDWRYGAVSIESINMDRAMAAGSSRPRGQSMTHKSSASSGGGGLATRARFIPADPKNTDIGYGVVHLYRDAEQTPGLYEDSYAAKTASSSAVIRFDEEGCSTICILAVPSYMMPSDLLGWAGEQAHEDVSHFRLIRTSKVNRYMVLMKFREASKARLWLKEYNGRAFSSMEPEYAHVVFVQSITFTSGEGNDTKSQPSSFPDMSDDPFMPKTQPTIKASSASSGEAGNLASTLTTRPLAPPPPNLVELPTCPVCLERMDETTGLLTILCQHVFHCDCLSKWRGSGCPVCRYTQHAPVPGSLRIPTTGADTENACNICHSETQPWICLICGNVGCGRYDEAHAFKHFQATGHAYAMDIETQHVWDYVGDGYVHRLIQNKADGKMVDLPDAYGKGTDGGMSAMGADMVPREKMDAMSNEYAYLLQSQLENQRSYFEDQLDRAVEKAGKAASSADKAQTALEEVTSMFTQLKKQHEDARASIKILEKDLDRSTKKAEKTDALARKLAKDWQEEKMVNEGLLQRLKMLDQKMTEKDASIEQLKVEKADLEEQNRDLSFFISGANKLQELKDAGENVEGEVTVAEASKGKRKGRKK